MNELNLVYAPNAIYDRISEPIGIIDDSVINIANKMIKYMHDQHAYGLAAPMFGISKQIITINTELEPIIMINPKITYLSDKKESMIEKSLSFVGIEVEILRSESIKIDYLGLNSEKLTLETSGISARCIQHEVDYLNGINILSYVSKMKREILTNKMIKFQKQGRIPHVHSSSCNH